MKQEIICLSCAADSLKRYKALGEGESVEPWPGEFVQHVPGKALDDYRCDYCGDDIKSGAECCARGNYLRGGNIDGWWVDFIRVNHAPHLYRLKR